MRASRLDERLLREDGRTDPQDELLLRAFETDRLSERAAALARLLFDRCDARAPVAASVLAELLRAAGAPALRALERDYRSPRFIRQWNVLAELDAERWASRMELGEEARLAAIAIGSVQRNGRIREEATRELGARDEAVSVGLLLLRINDPVFEVATTALKALERWRQPGHAASLARYLPLLDALDEWVRTGQRGLARSFHALLDQDESVLLAQTRSDDHALRASAYRRLTAVRAGKETIEEVLERGLVDPAPRIRRWAAGTAVDGSVTPAAVRDRLASRMWEDPNPRIREAALRWLRRRDDGERAIERAVFDPNAGVRFYARRFAQRAGLRIAYRERALATLVDPSSDRFALVGALALLSDNGLREDCAKIQAFLEHSHRDVRREAQRTLELLGL